jgi:hypothetical protein
MGGAASTSFIAPVPLRSIFRVERDGGQADIFRPTSGKVFK